MKNALRRIRGESQKNIVKLLDQLSGKYSAWEVWQDFITMSAISIANTLGGPYAQEREKTYRERIKKYTEKEQLVFPQMFAEMVAELDSNPDQDFLGDLFMSLGMGNEWKGQFFTPYSVCKAMAGITYRNDLKEKVEQKGWVSVSDPACGAGALLCICQQMQSKSHKLSNLGVICGAGSGLPGRDDVLHSTEPFRMRRVCVYRRFHCTTFHQLR